MSPKSRQPIEDSEPEELPDLPPGYVPVTRPRKAAPVQRKRSVWWGIGGFVVLVAATLVVILLVSKPGDPREAPDTTAKAVAEALTAHDLAGVDSYLCEKAPHSPEQTAFFGSFGNASVLAVDELASDLANATVRSGDRPGIDLVLQMHGEDGSWCVFGPVPCQVMSPDGGSGVFAEVCRTRPHP